MLSNVFVEWVSSGRREEEIYKTSPVDGHGSENQKKENVELSKRPSNLPQIAGKRVVKKIASYGRLPTDSP